MQHYLICRWRTLLLSIQAIAENLPQIWFTSLIKNPQASSENEKKIILIKLAIFWQFKGSKSKFTFIATTNDFWKCIVSKFYIEPFIKFLAERNNINEIWNRFLAENNNIIENDAIKVYETLKKINYLHHNVLDILISPDEMQLYLYNFYKKEKHSTRSMDKILQQFQVINLFIYAV